MIARVLEPELMDDPAESQSYDEMDHGNVNETFVRDLLAAGEPGEQVLDLGTGTARIPITLCEHCLGCRVIASDAAVSMLEIARINIAVAGFEHRIQPHLGDSKTLPFADADFDCVMSNSLLHHLPEPQLAMAEMLRVVRPGGRLFVRDLMRPQSELEVERLVATYAANESAANQQLLRQSLHAALTLEEMRALVEQFDVAGDSVQATSDRHWTWATQRN